jgi:four helix bundle protein
MTKTVYDLVAFRRAVDLVAAVYDATAQFPPSERYGLTSQLRRAAVGVCSHIAEGQGRLTAGEWRQFLSQARGSLFEVEAQCIVANRLGFISTESLDALRRMIGDVARPLAGLIRWVRRSEKRVATGNRQLATR